MNNNTNKIYKYLLALLGLFLVLYYIWFRFIRERLPMDIPFENSYLTFIILFMICLVYIYIIIRLLKPKTPSKFILSLFMRIQHLYKPFLILDEILQNNYTLCNILDNYLLIKFNYLTKKYKLYVIKNQNIFNIFINICPKLLLTLIFCIDVLWFHQIKILYYFLWIGFIPAIMKYILYLMKKRIEYKTIYLDTNFFTIPIKKQDNKQKEYNYFFDIINVLNWSGCMNTKKFIELQAFSLTCHSLYDLYDYDCVETPEARQEYEKKYKIKLCPIYVGEPRNDAISIELSKEYFKWMPIVINISAFFEELDTYKEETKKIQDQTIIITLVLYVICWLYILFITLCTLNQESWINILEALKEILKNMEEPFSLIKINEINTNYEQQNKQN